MFWRKKSSEEAEKLPKPQAIPIMVQKYLAAECKMVPDLAQLLKAVVHKSATQETAFDIRVFDESDALAKKVEVKGFASLDGRPDLIIYEGWFDEGSKQVELEEKKKVAWTTTILSEAEIRQKVEGLSQPGSTVFFYLAAGPDAGGPLGRGAAVIELNPNYPDKHQKKYNVYTAPVVDMKPVGMGQKLFDADKPKEITVWIKERHRARTQE